MSVLFMLLSSFTNLILLVFIRRCCLCSLYSSPYFLVIQRLTGNRENERMRIHEELRLGQFLYPSPPSPLDLRERRPPWRVGQFSSVVTCRSRCTNVQPGRRLPYVHYDSSNTGVVFWHARRLWVGFGVGGSSLLGVVFSRCNYSEAKLYIYI